MHLPEGIVISTYTAEDVVPVMEAYPRWLALEARQTGVPQADIDAQINSWGTYQERLSLWLSRPVEPPDSYTATLRMHERLVGFFSGKVTMKGIADAAKVSRVYLDEDVQRRGIGTVLMNHFHDLVGPEKDVYLDVFEGNKPAICF